MAKLGSLEFDLIADNSQLVSAFAEATAKANQASAAIVRSVKAQEIAVVNAGNALADVYSKASADAAKEAADLAKGALEAEKAYNALAAAAKAAKQPIEDTGTAAKKTGDALGEVGKKGAGQLDLTTQAALKVGLALVGAQTAATLAAKAIEGVVSQLVDFTKAAGEAEAVQLRLTQAYGATAPALKEAADAIGAYGGISKTTAEGMIADNQAQIQAFGLSSASVTEFGKRMADLAAVNGKTVPEAFKAGTAALSGNTDALKAFGIVINESVLQQYGGLTKFQAEHLDLLTDEQRAQAIMNVIIAETGDVTGSAAEASDTLNGKLAELQAGWEDLSAVVGKEFLPYVKAVVDVLIDLVDAAKTVLPEMAHLQEIGEKFAQQKGVPEWLTTIIDVATGGKAGIIAGLLGLTTDPAFRAKTDQELATPPATKEPSPEAAAKASAKAAADAIKDAARKDEAIRRIEKERDKYIAQLNIEAAQREHDLTIKSLDAKRIAYEVERDAKLKAVDEQEKASLKAIDAEAQAAKKASDARIADLQVRQQSEERAAEDRHRDAVRAIELEQQATKEATQAAIALKQHERDEWKRAAEDKKDAAIKAIEEEAYAAKRESEATIAQIQHQKIEESRAAEDGHKAAVRAIDRQEQAAQKAAAAQHARTEKSKDDAKNAADARKESAIRALDAEVEATKHARDLADAARKQQQTEDDRVIDARRTAEDRALDASRAAQAQALDERRTAEDRALDQQRTAQDRLRKDQQTAEDRAIDLKRAAEDKAAEAIKKVDDSAHQNRLDNLDTEKRELTALYDQQLEKIDRLKTAEDDRHQAAMQALDDEIARRNSLLDAEGAALDAAEKSDRDRAALAKLQDERGSAVSDVGAAESTGNLATIEDARRKLAEVEDQIRQFGVDQERDAARTELAIRRDQLKEEQTAWERQEQAIHDLNAQQVADYKQAEQAMKDAALSSVDARRSAEEDAWDAITEAAAAAYTAYKAQLADQRATEDAALAARREAEDQALADARTAWDQRLTDDRAAEDAAIEQSKTAWDQRLADSRLAEDTYLTDRRTAEDAALAAGRYAEDQAFAARKLAIDDAYKKETDAIAKTYDDPVSGLLAKQKQQADDAADKYAKRKQSVDDAYETEQRRIADTYDDPVSGLLAKQRQMAEDAAHDYGLRKDAVNAAYQDEQRLIEATYDDETTGVIPAMHRAQAEADIQYGLRKQTTDDAYRDEQRSIKDTYTDPVTGLIPIEQRAQAETESQYNQMAADVRASAEAQKATIKDIYTNPGKTGLLDFIDQAKKDADQTLRDQQGYWERWRDGVREPIQDIINKYNELIAAMKKARNPNGGGADGDKPGDAGGGMAFPEPPGPPRAGMRGGIYRPVVDGAADDSYWTDQGTHGGHPAADIFAPMGSAIHAPVGGTMSTGTFPLGGNAGFLQGDDGRWYYFAHAQSRMKDGRVEPGDRIGSVGDTGNARGGRPHLHMSIASSQKLFDAYNGSGDIWGDASYWKGHGGPVDLPKPGGGTQQGDPNASPSTIRAYIDQQAEARQIDPKIAERVVAEEGHFVPMDVGKFSTGWSFWPFQLHYGGGAYSMWGNVAGMGNDFTQQKHLQPNDPANWAPSTDFGLDRAKSGGWDQWYGARKVGITGYMGIVKGMAKGGTITEPTLLVGTRSGPYAMAGESGPEFVVPEDANGGMGHQSLQMPIYLGNREVERLWIDGYKLAVGRGRTPGGLVR